MKPLERIARLIEYIVNVEDTQALFADGYDHAILGYDHLADRVVYSTALILDHLRYNDGMTEEEAYEYAEFNIFGAHVGEHTPIWCYDEV